MSTWIVITTVIGVVILVIMVAGFGAIMNRLVHQAENEIRREVK